MIYLNLLAVGVLFSSLTCPVQVSRNSCLTGIPRGASCCGCQQTEREQQTGTPSSSSDELQCQNKHTGSILSFRIFRSLMTNLTFFFPFKEKYVI